MKTIIRFGMECSHARLYTYWFCGAASAQVSAVVLPVPKRRYSPRKKYSYQQAQQKNRPHYCVSQLFRRLRLVQIGVLVV